jgi:hypothetical protein
MNEMETQLSRLFNAAVGEPPNDVTVRAIRRRVLRRRLVMSVTTTAALSLAAAIGLAVSANATGPHPAVNHSTRASEPRYYFENDAPMVGSTRIENVVRSVATGAVTGRIRCPGTQRMINAAAAADDQAFFVSCTTTGGSDTRIYRFVVRKSGQVGRLQPVRGGALGSARTGNMAVTATGSQLAIIAAPLGAGRTSEVIVINTRSGAHAIWHAIRLPGGLRFLDFSVSFADSGRELAAFGSAQCVRGPGTCRSPGEEMVAVNNAARGGRLADGRVIFTQSQLIKPSAGWLNDAFISPDGTSAIAAVNAFGPVTVYQISAATGRPTRILLKLGGLHRRAAYGFISPDPSGHFVLISGRMFAPSVSNFNGWISHGKLVPLKPFTFMNIEVW